MESKASVSHGEHASASSVERRTGERRSVRRSNQAVLRQIVERLADGIVVVSADGRIQFANPAAERLFGRSATDLVD